MAPWEEMMLGESTFLSLMERLRSVTENLEMLSYIEPAHSPRQVLF